MGDIQIISASAGSGKTYKLATILDDEIGTQRVRPNAILATTFTKKAAAELQERARNRLLTSGRIEDAQRLNAARIGTVNAVCGGLVDDFCFDLGLPPNLQVLDEAAAQEALRKTFALVVTAEEQRQLAGLKNRFEGIDWEADIHRIVALARINRVSAKELKNHAECSLETYRPLFGNGAAKQSNCTLELQRALEQFIAGVDPSVDETQATKNALSQAKTALSRMKTRLTISWVEWVRLYKLSTGAKSRFLGEIVQQAAAAHDHHPDLLADIERLTKTVFDIAGRCLTSYQKYKQEQGVLDFVDQETLTLKLLSMPRIRAQLAEDLDLILVDEFQDTSPLQLAIFLELAKIAKRSVWVGDQKQSIFGFRDADPVLMDAAIETILAGAEPETLKKSWRSRPELVRVTSEVFVKAFSQHGFPSERVYLEPAQEEKAEGLGSAFARWILQSTNAGNDAKALAAAVKASLDDPSFSVRDPGNAMARPLRAGDLAILCRTRNTCKGVAAALESAGIPVILARTGLCNTLEATVVLTGLRLMLFPRDTLAVAELARLLWSPQDGDAWVEQVIAPDGMDFFKSLEPICNLMGVSEELGMAGAMEYFDRAMELLDIRKLCLRWGGAEQRLANLDKLRAFAAEYVKACHEQGKGCSPAALVAFFNELEDDEKAILSTTDAVQVTTWHSSKGLEWPVVVLFELQKTYSGQALGVQLVAEQKGIDLANPLAHRWIRYWPYPFGGQRTGFPFQERLCTHPAQLEANAREWRQELRVLYVGWTRARDRIILATRSKRLQEGMLGLLQDNDGKCFIKEPTDGMASWDGITFAMDIRQAAPEVDIQTATATAPEPEEGYVAAGPKDYPAALIQASRMTGSCRIVRKVSIGPRIALNGAPQMDHVGEALHGFLAADRPQMSHEQRVDMAQGLLDRWGVSASLNVEAVLQASDHLQAWIRSTWQEAHWHREWPVSLRLDTGTLVTGFVDLAIRTSAGFVLIDHKSFPGAIADALERVLEFGGQLWAYATAIEGATGMPVVAKFIHLPIAGIVVELEAVQ